ncbi:MAG TPA: 16S rRNA (guanine(527)-N(7))-methyltransferase RsmG [Solirubrobacteraceae bacterium]|jgi:16S rRNA (guanine527-N7)-methyltransferase
MTAGEAGGGDELAQRFELPPGSGARLDRLQHLLASDPQAPTAVREPQRILDDHLADSLVALELEAVRSAGSVVDVGSGAGLPGLPLAIALPRARFTLVESSSRKCEFIARAVTACGLENVDVVDARIEEWADGRGGFEVALARALAPLEVVIEYGAPLLRIGGELIAWRGRRDSGAEDRAAHAADLLGLRPGEVRRVKPYEVARARHLHLFSKVMDTPAGFPRRPGVASKRPLGAT